MPYEDPAITPLPYGTSGVNFKNELDSRFAALNDAVVGAHGDAVALSGATGLVGRIVGVDRSVGAATSGTGLSLVIPAGASFIIESALYKVEVDGSHAVVAGVPANKASGVYGYLSLNEDGELDIAPEHWFDALPTTPPEGLPCIGKVTTDSDSVLSIDDAAADKYQTHAAIMTRLAELEAAGTGGGGGGGGGTGDVTQEELDAVQAQVDDLRTELTALQNAADTNVVATISESEIMTAEVLRVMAFVIKEFPLLAAKIKAGADIPGITGNAELWTNGDLAPIVYAGGNARRNPDKQVVE